MLEKDDQIAQRNNSSLFQKIGYKPTQVDRIKFLEMPVFKYLISNTDWSVQYQQNIKLLRSERDKLPIAVPYDFDHAGIVRSPYAKPAPALKLENVLIRRYRGFCVTDMSIYKPIFDKFNKLKSDIYAFYIENLEISSSYKTKAVKFLDESYDTINDPGKELLAFGYLCNPLGIGNVVIKGLGKMH